MKRRAFCRMAATAAAGIPLAPYLGRAVSQEQGATVIVDLADFSNFVLNVVDGAKYITHTSVEDKIIVVRKSETEVAAFHSKCTHNGCTVGLPVNNVCTCPCHNSKFDDNGAVLQGPAVKNLDWFAATLSGTLITIDTTPLGISDIPARHAGAPSITVLPDRIIVRFSDAGTAGFRSSLYDLEGRLIGRAVRSGENTAEIAAATLKNGQYILKTGLNGNTAYRRILIHPNR